MQRTNVQNKVAMTQKFHHSQHLSFIDLIRKHRDQKKQFDIADAYKLIYQSVFGPEHLLSDHERVMQRLVQELDAMEGEFNEPLIEPISVDGNVVRLNLRPYKLLKGDATQLFQAMVQSSQQIRGSKDKFLLLWRQFLLAVMAGMFEFDREAVLRFDAQMSTQNYPAVHHSPGYREANRPAYRVLSLNSAMTLVMRLIERDRDNVG